MEIPGYKILDTLGQGGMATVYLAIQESFERKVAIKVMSPQLAQDPAFGDRFQREAKIVSQMNHPNIVTVYDVGVADNHHYLAMQYVQGKELRTKFKELHLMERITVVKEVASALNYAGNKGYVHRDVKPDNVMLSEEDGRAVLMDFGIAKTVDTNHSMTKTGMAIGTPYYMSPEQAQGKSVDKRSDIYSLGIMFFQLLTGRVPYDAESQVAIGIKHITEPVPFLPKHLRMFQPIIDKVMAKDPASRYQNGAELIRDLDKITIADLDEVDRLVLADVTAANKTDPNAETILGDATPLPPTLNTGNVTTADAARHAQRIGVESQDLQQAKKKNSPMIALAVIVLLLAGGAWFISQQGGQNVAPPAQPASVENGAAPKVITTENPQVETHPVESPPAENKQKQEEADRAAALADKEKQSAAALASAQQAEKKKQLDLAKAQEQKKQEEIASAEKEKQNALARAQQEAASAAQARQQEIASRLSKADALREQGQLVTPEGNNAVTAYSAVLELDAGNAKATQALKDIENSYLMAIRYQIEEGKIDEATAKLREASKVFPNSVAVGGVLALLQKKTAELDAAKAAAVRPKVTKVVINDTAFESMQLAPKADLPIGRTAYIGFSYQNFEGATALLQAVLYDGSRTLKVTQKAVVVTGAQGTVFFTLANPVEGFADGGYNLDLLLNDQKLITATFNVKH